MKSPQCKEPKPQSPIRQQTTHPAMPQRGGRPLDHMAQNDLLPFLLLHRNSFKDSIRFLSSHRDHHIACDSIFQITHCLQLMPFLFKHFYHKVSRPIGMPVSKPTIFFQTPLIDEQQKKRCHQSSSSQTLQTEFATQKIEYSMVQEGSTQTWN